MGRNPLPIYMVLIVFMMIMENILIEEILQVFLSQFII